MSSSFYANSRFRRALSLSSSFIRRTASRPVSQYSARQQCSVTSDTPSDVATSAIGVPLARASSACLSYAITSSGRRRVLFERLIGDSARSLWPRKSLIAVGPVQCTPA